MKESGIETARSSAEVLCCQSSQHLSDGLLESECVSPLYQPFILLSEYSALSSIDFKLKEVVDWSDFDLTI